MMTAPFFKVAFSIISVRIINLLAGFIAMMMVGGLGKTALAAAILAVFSMNMLLTINISLLQVLSIFIRQYIAQNKKSPEFSQLIGQGVLIALVCALISYVILNQMTHLLAIFHQDPQLILLTHGYFQYAALGIFPALILNVFSQINLGVGRIRVVVVTELLSLILRVLLSYVLILGHFQLPKMGLTGMAIADLVVNLWMSMMCIFYLYFSKYYNKWFIFKHFFSFDKRLCKLILRHGTPMAIQTVGELAAITLSIFLMGFYGINALAAIQVTNQYLTLCMILGFGFTQALTLFVREVVYQEKEVNQLIFKYMKTALQTLYLINIPVALLFIMQPQFLLSIFVDVKEKHSLFMMYSQAFFLFNAMLILLDSTRSILTGILRGIGDANAAMGIGLFSLWIIALPFSLLSYLLHMGPVMTRFGVVLGFLSWVLLLALRVYKMLQNSNDVLVYRKI